MEFDDILKKEHGHSLNEIVEIGSPFSGWSINVEEKEIPVPHFHLIKGSKVHPEIKIAIAIADFHILRNHSKPETATVSSNDIHRFLKTGFKKKTPRNKNRDI